MIQIVIITSLNTYISSYVIFWDLVKTCVTARSFYLMYRESCGRLVSRSPTTARDPKVGVKWIFFFNCDNNYKKFGPVIGNENKLIWGKICTMCSPI